MGALTIGKGKPGGLCMGRANGHRENLPKEQREEPKQAPGVAKPLPGEGLEIKQEKQPPAVIIIICYYYYPTLVKCTPKPWGYRVICHPLRLPRHRPAGNKDALCQK